MSKKELVPKETARALKGRYFRLQFSFTRKSDFCPPQVCPNHPSQLSLFKNLCWLVYLLTLSLSIFSLVTRKICETEVSFPFLIFVLMAYFFLIEIWDIPYKMFFANLLSTWLTKLKKLIKTDFNNRKKKKVIWPTSNVSENSYIQLKPIDLFIIFFHKKKKRYFFNLLSDYGVFGKNCSRSFSFLLSFIIFWYLSISCWFLKIEINKQMNLPFISQFWNHYKTLCLLLK